MVEITETRIEGSVLVQYGFYTSVQCAGQVSGRLSDLASCLDRQQQLISQIGVQGVYTLEHCCSYLVSSEVYAKQRILSGPKLESKKAHQTF